MVELLPLKQEMVVRAHPPEPFLTRRLMAGREVLVLTI